MKNLLLSLMVLASGSAALACMPPPPGYPAYLLQKPFLSDLMDSDSVKQAILSQGNDVTIKAIVPGAQYQITLSNKCRLKVVRDFSDASVGTCPELLPLIVEDISCKK